MVFVLNLPPNEYDKLTKCRDCIYENVALFSSSGNKLEFKVFNDSVYSGLSDTLTLHTDTINADYNTFVLYTKTLCIICKMNIYDIRNIKMI